MSGKKKKKKQEKGKRKEKEERGRRRLELWSLQHPQTGASFSDAPTRSCGKTDIKRFKNDELNATNFDLSLFWKLENFANLDGAEAVESEDRFDSFDERITRLPDGRYCTPFVNG